MTDFICTKHESYLNKNEIKKYMAQVESLEFWLQKNIGHPDWEKVNRQRNITQMKVTVREQREEKQKYPDRFKGGSLDYNLPKNLKV